MSVTNFIPDSAEAVLEIIEPKCSLCGITRVANVTRLDNIGLPVWQAIRPLSKNLTVSQGKGLTDAVAKVSAIMESFEMFHAEEVQVDVRASISKMMQRLPYNVLDLTMICEDIRAVENIPVNWTKAKILGTNEDAFLPTQYLQLDFTNQQLQQPVFNFANSTGIAASLTYTKAIIHGVYECIERHTVFVNDHAALDTQFVFDNCPSVNDVIEDLRSKNYLVDFYLYESGLDLPCIKVSVTDKYTNECYFGTACNANFDLAVQKALVEAVQSRLTKITGTRDDILSETYVTDAVAATGSFNTIGSTRRLTLDMQFESPRKELTYLTDLVNGRLQSPVIVCDLSKPAIDIPVVFTVIPKLYRP